MLVAPRVTYPGVYIQEVKSDVRTIVGVDTATTAFIGRAKRGPVNQPIVVNSYGDFERMFGGLWLQSSLGFAVNDFFLNGGAKAVVVRLFNDGAAVPPPGAPAPLTPQAAAAAARAKADEVQANNASNPAKAAANDVATAAEAAVAAIDATAESVAAAARAKADEFAGASNPVKTAAQAVADAAAGIVAPPPVADPIPSAKSKMTVDTLTLEAVSEGKWGDKLSAVVTNIELKFKDALAKRYGVEADDLFTLTVTDNGTGFVETFANVTVANGPRRIDKVLANESVLVRVLGDLPTTRPVATVIDPDEPNNNPHGEGGSDGQKLNDLLISGSADEKTGIYALDGSDIFNLLCIPPYDIDDVSDTADVPGNIWALAAAYCEKRRALLIVDSPQGWNTKKKAVDGVPLPGIGAHQNAAIYFPHIKKPNLLRDNQVEEFVPCGAVAGIMARTDASRGVWKAPAGLEASLTGVFELSVPLTDAENGELNPLGVNCLRKLPAAGNVVWGARTLVGDDRLASQWKYIPVRRTTLYIEESIYRNIQWAVFEPNDEPLWSQLRLNIGVFMHDLYRQGAFQGQSPKSAYFVKCDSSTTTQSDIDKGIVNIVVGFAPLKPAEFVVVYIQQITGQLAA